MTKHLRSQQEWQWLKHGINGASRALYDALLDRQDRVCYVCREAPNDRRLVLDHNHETGKIRGLLCGRCNILAGQVELLMKNKALLDKIISYIEADGEPLLSEAQTDIIGFDPNLTRPYVDYKQKQVRKRYHELLETQPKRSQTIPILATEFGLTTRTIRRYLEKM